MSDTLHNTYSIIVQKEFLEIAIIVEVLYFGDLIVLEIKLLQFLLVLKILDFLYPIRPQMQTLQNYILQILNNLNHIVFKV